MTLITMTPGFGLDGVLGQLRWACDALIPHDDEQGMPSALEAGVVETLLPRALKARPELAPPLVAALARLPAQAPADPLAALKALGSADFDQISHLVAGAYFLDFEVNRRLKYPGQEAMDYSPDYDEVMEVAQRVMDRGSIYIDPNAT
jgi:hypothetical protein